MFEEFHTESVFEQTGFEGVFFVLIFKKDRVSGLGMQVWTDSGLETWNNMEVTIVSKLKDSTASTVEHLVYMNHHNTASTVEHLVYMNHHNTASTVEHLVYMNHHTHTALKQEGLSLSLSLSKIMCHCVTQAQLSPLWHTCPNITQGTKKKTKSCPSSPFYGTPAQTSPRGQRNKPVSKPLLWHTCPNITLGTKK